MSSIVQVEDEPACVGKSKPPKKSGCIRWETKKKQNPIGRTKGNSTAKEPSKKKSPNTTEKKKTNLEIEIGKLTAKQELQKKEKVKKPPSKVSPTRPPSSPSPPSPSRTTSPSRPTSSSKPPRSSRLSTSSGKLQEGRKRAARELSGASDSIDGESKATKKRRNTFAGK